MNALEFSTFENCTPLYSTLYKKHVDIVRMYVWYNDIIFVSETVIEGTYKIAVVHVLIHIMVLSHCQKSFEM